MKKPRRTETPGPLNINSMMDMMTIILVFLLKSFSSEDVSVAPSDNLQLPFSTAQAAPKLAVNLVVEKNQVIVDGKPILQLGTADDPSKPGSKVPAVPETELQGQLLPKLFDVLQQKATDAKALGERAGGANKDLGFKGQILMQVDKDMPFNVVRTVMYTAGQAQFGEFKFVVIKLHD